MNRSLTEAREHRAECACVLCEAADLFADEIPEADESAREEAATGLAEEAEERALVGDGWEPVGVLRSLWRDPQTRRLYRRADALALHLRDCGVL